MEEHLGVNLLVLITRINLVTAVHLGPVPASFDVTVVRLLHVVSLTLAAPVGLLEHVVSAILVHIRHSVQLGLHIAHLLLILVIDVVVLFERSPFLSNVSSSDGLNIHTVFSNREGAVVTGADLLALVGLSLNLQALGVIGSAW